MLNTEFTQNATFICASPSNIPNSYRFDINPANKDLKEMFFRNLFPQSCKYFETLQRLKAVDARLPKLKKDFENLFLVASGETLKKIGEYTQLQQSV